MSGFLDRAKEQARRVNQGKQKVDEVQQHRAATSC